MEIFVRSAYNYDMNAASDETGIDCQTRWLLDKDSGELVLVATPSLAKQAFAEECDINTIVTRFGLTGQLPVNVRMPTYEDFLDVPSFDQAMNAIVEAQQAFMQMPANVRARFHNDPAEFVDFCSQEENRGEAVKLGLVPAAAAAVASTPSQTAQAASATPTPTVAPPATVAAPPAVS